MVDATALTPTIGSEVSIDADTLLSGRVADELRDLLVERGVLVVRGIDFDDEQLRAFAQTMGELRMGTIYEQENAGMLKVVHILGTFFWHVDGTYTGLPPFATVLAPRALSPEGGDTEFANTYAAFEALPPEEQAYLETLQVVHTMKAGQDRATPDATLEQIENYLKYRATQPLVWHHRSGRKSLVVGETASHIVGMHPAPSAELIERLQAHITQRQFVYHHTWQMGDIVMWDNTGTMHRVLPFDPDAGRLLHRFTLEGIEPFVGVGQLADV
jgi:alpha-ketoglutarate-dependent taurine dioxygenase